MKNLIYALLFTLVLSAAASAQKTKPKPKPKPAPKPAVTKTTGACPGTNGLTAAEITGLLGEHNRIRAALGLSKLTWSCDLATLAQAWASRSVFQHRETTFGENMFVSTNSTASPVSALQNWEKEKAFWNNTTGVCQAGKTCTHFTQIVWRGTTQVGCGINRAATGNWKLVMVCNYDPGSRAGAAY